MEREIKGMKEWNELDKLTGTVLKNLTSTLKAIKKYKKGPYCCEGHDRFSVEGCLPKNNEYFSAMSLINKKIYKLIKEAGLEDRYIDLGDECSNEQQTQPLDVDQLRYEIAKSLKHSLKLVQKYNNEADWEYEAINETRMGYINATDTVKEPACDLISSLMDFMAKTAVTFPDEELGY